MSNFISDIFAPGFSEMPPLSKVTALPTKPSVGPCAPGARDPGVAHGDQRGLLLGALGDGGEGAHPARRRCPRVPRPRPSGPRSPRASASRVLGERVGVRSLPGRFCRSRARLTAFATSAASATVASRSPGAETIRRSRLLRRRPRPPVLSVGRGGLVALEAVVAEDRALDERAGDAGSLAAGACQQSARVEISRARSHATAAATRSALGGQLRARPRPTSSQRLPVGVGQGERLERAAGLARGEQLGELRGQPGAGGPRRRTRPRRRCRRRWSRRVASWWRPPWLGTISGWRSTRPHARSILVDRSDGTQQPLCAGPLAAGSRSRSTSIGVLASPSHDSQERPVPCPRP